MAETYAAVLGLTMIAVGFILILVCVGGLVYYYWPRSGGGAGQNRARLEVPSEDQHREGQP